MEPLTFSDATGTKQQPKINILNHCRPFIGIILAILSALSVVFMSLFAKLCLVLPPFEIGVIRFMVLLILAIALVVYSNDRIIYSPRITAFLVLRGVCGTCGMLTRFYAVQNMPLGDATVLTSISPIFVAIFARIFLKERLHFMYSILIALCLAGVILIARPTFIFGHPDTVPEYDNILVPSLVAVLSAIFTSTSIIVLRVLAGTYHIKTSVILFYFGITGLIFIIIGSYIDRGFQFPFCQSLDYVYALCVGISAVLAQWFITGALRYSKAFIVALVRTSGIFFGFVLQILIYSLVPTGFSFGGASLILITNTATFVFKWFQYKAETGAFLDRSV